MTQKRPPIRVSRLARWVAARRQIAPVDSPAPARGIGLLLPPSEPDAPAMDDSDREKNCASNQEAPELLVKASVEVLAPARQAQQSGKKSR